MFGYPRWLQIVCRELQMEKYFAVYYGEERNVPMHIPPGVLAAQPLLVKQIFVRLGLQPQLLVVNYFSRGNKKALFALEIDAKFGGCFWQVM